VEGCAQLPIRRHGVRLIDRALVDRAHEAGLQVHVWTIDEPDEMRRLIDLGVDGLMTDQPAVLKAVLVERGLWTS
jgi:glycerophosphoryl diester phosphodiesterase